MLHAEKKMMGDTRVTPFRNGAITKNACLINGTVGNREVNK